MLPIPQNDWRGAEVLASWIELSALATDGGFVARGTVLDSFKDSGLFDTDSLPHGAASDSATPGTAHAMVADIWLVLDRRSHVVGSAWPFDLTSDKLTRKDGCRVIADVAAYTAMLLIDAAGSGWYEQLTLDSGDPGRTHFESIVEASMRRLSGGRTSRFGAPFPADWPKDFPGRVKRLAEQFGIKAREGDITDFASEAQQDGSLDVVSRLRLGDEEGGSAYILVQCATGEKWLSNKKGEPMMSLWRNFIQWDGPQFRAVAVPYSLREQKALAKASLRHDCAIILDRLRLACGEPDKGLDAPFRATLAKWCVEKLSKCTKKNAAARTPSRRKAKRARKAAR